MFEFFIIFLMVCIGFSSMYRVVYFNLTRLEVLYACCAMWLLGFLTFVGTAEPPKELVGINILTYYITTYIWHIGLQTEAMVPLEFAIAICLVLFGGTIFYLRNVIKKLNI